MTRISIQELERGKFLPDGGLEESTVRVAQDGPITVDEITDPVTVQEIINPVVVDEILAPVVVQEILNPVVVSTVATVTQVTHVDNVDSLDLVTEVAHITNLDLVDELTHVTTVSTVTTVAAVTNITNPIRQSDYSVVPHETYTHSLRYLLNAGSPDQNVSATLGAPASFSTTATTRSLIHSIDIIIVARNLVSVLDYGIVTGGLTNGVQIIKKVGAVETVFCTIKRMVEYCHPSTSGSFQTISLKSNATEEVIVVSIILKDPVIMLTGESLIVRIQDNLSLATSGIAYQRASVLLKEV